MGNSRAQAIPSLHIVGRMDDSRNDGQNNHETSFQQALAPVAVMPKTKANIGHQEG